MLLAGSKFHPSRRESTLEMGSSITDQLLGPATRVPGDGNGRHLGISVSLSTEARCEDFHPVQEGLLPKRPTWLQLLASLGTWDYYPGNPDLLLPELSFDDIDISRFSAWPLAVKTNESC